MALKTITVITPSVFTEDVLEGYNFYSDQDGKLNVSVVDATTANSGYETELSDGVVHSVTAKPVGVATGEYNAPSDAVNVDLSGNVPSATAPVITVTDTLPKLSNFRIENATPDRVYFDSSSDITGLTTGGFTISGKTISSVTVNGTGTTGHYFTVSVPFTYWDNNTIRLESGDATVYDFTLTYIENNIAEPTASTIRYVTTTASGGGDGTTEGNAWTWAEALSNQSAGMTIYVKAGNYGDISNTYVVHGAVDNPIKWIGYKNTPNDITSNYYDYGVTWSTSEMPTITNNLSSTDRPFYLACRYVIFKNIQASNAASGTYTGGTNAPHNVVMERVNFKDCVNPSGNTYSAFIFYGSQTNGYYNIRLKDNRVVNANLNGITMQGSVSTSLIGGNLIDGCKVYNDNTSSTNARLDYGIAINGIGSIVRNCRVESFNNTETAGSTHGIGIRGGAFDNSSFNLITGNVVINQQEGLYIRNYGNHHNVIKGNIVGNNGNTSNDDRGGIWFWGGANYNVVENNKINDVDFAIGLRELGSGDNESATGVADISIGVGNIVRNNIFSNAERVLYSFNSATGDANFDDNDFVNNTFYNCDYFYEAIDNSVVISNLNWKNNIFHTITNGFLSSGNTTGMNFENNVFYNSWTAGIGTGIITTNPNFIDTTDFVPREETMTASKIAGVNYDYNGKERDNPTTIGAVTLVSESVGDIPATTSLLFKTDFEGTVALGSRINGYQRFTGSSLGYTFPTDGQLGMGTSSNGIHTIDGGVPSRIDVELITATGHEGNQTTVLHQRVNSSTGPTQAPWQFNNITTEPDEFYMSYWQKLDADFLANPGDWRTLWETKTANYDNGSDDGTRIIFEAYNWGGDEYLRFDCNTNSGGNYNVIWRDQPLASLPKGEWFKFEVYVKYRKDNTGEAWVKINGTKVVSKVNVPMVDTNQDPLKYIFAAQIYGGGTFPIEHWVDDVEIWDGIPLH